MVNPWEHHSNPCGPPAVLSVKGVKIRFRNVGSLELHESTKQNATNSSSQRPGSGYDTPLPGVDKLRSFSEVLLKVIQTKTRSQHDTIHVCVCVSSGCVSLQLRSTSHPCGHAKVHEGRATSKAMQTTPTLTLSQIWEGGEGGCRIGLPLRRCVFGVQLLIPNIFGVGEPLSKWVSRQTPTTTGHVRVHMDCHRASCRVVLEFNTPNGHHQTKAGFLLV